MNHSTREIAAAISSVIAWGRASFDSLNLIFNSPVLGGNFRPYFSPAVINAQWTRQVPGKGRRQGAGARLAPDLLVQTALAAVSGSFVISRFTPRFTLQPHVRDGHAFLQRLAHV